MFQGSSSFREANRKEAFFEEKISSFENVQDSFEKISSKVKELFSSDYKNSQESKVQAFEKIEFANESDQIKDVVDDVNVQEMFENLFAKDLLVDEEDAKEILEAGKREAVIEKIDITTDEISKMIGTSSGIKEVIDNHPEKAELWRGALESIEKLNDPEASPFEIRSAQSKLSNLKGQIMEVAVKDKFSEIGLDVELQQRVVEGESGGTRPDVIAINKKDHSIEIFSIRIDPGEMISVECKCGSSSYMTSQLNHHISNQLSGQEGKKVLLTTSDVRGTPQGLAVAVCQKYGAKFVPLDVSVFDVEHAIKEVSKR